MNKLCNLQLKARDAIWFLECHPAINKDIFSSIGFSIQKVCKKGYDEIAQRGIQIRQSSKHAKRFKDRFDKEIKEFDKKYPNASEAQKYFINIDVSYKELFGEEWKFDHIEYWGNISFKVFKGDTKIENAWKQDNWLPFEGFSVYERSFEEMIIKFAEKFKKLFGDFDSEDFLTKKEKENHKKTRQLTSCLKSDKNGYIRSVWNPKYIHVNDAELNRRWLKWFVKTDYCKKNWDEMKTIIKGEKNV